jgi:arsenate reductase
VLANLMFELPAVAWSTTERSSPALWVSEVVATVGLLLVIQGCVRTGRSDVVAFAVAAWIGGAYWFTSSTGFANPAVTIARTLSDSFTGIAPASAPAFIAAQLVGCAIAFGLVRLFYPHPRGGALTTDHERVGEARPEVLFVCVHNAGRSQMAAALLAHHAGDMVVARSAGSAPADEISPAVVRAMAEIGIDLDAAGSRPKKLDEAALAASDVVVTMGCGDACPIYPGKRYEDWVLDDPAGLDVTAVRPIRDEIDRRVRALVADLVPAVG